jgi:HSP20 family protein
MNPSNIKESNMMYYFSPRINPNRRPWMMPSEAMRRNFEDCECSIPADVRSTDEGYEIRALIAGVSAEDLDIQFTRDTVSIKGEYKVETAENDNFLRKELPEGKFSRDFSFSEPVNAEKSTAALKDGILMLFIPKAEEAKPRSIKVKAE